MLPHKKYFSSVPCPDNEDGDCRRPYCHFFHKFKSCSDKGNNSRQTTATVASSTLPWPADNRPVNFSTNASRVPPCEANHNDSSHDTTHYASLPGPAVGANDGAPTPNTAPSETAEVNSELDDTTEDKLHIDEDAASQTTSDDDPPPHPDTRDSSNRLQDAAVLQEKINLARSYDSSSQDDGKDDLGNESSCTTEHNSSKDEAEDTCVSGQEQSSTDPSSISQSAAQSSVDTSALSATLLQSDLLQKLVSEAVKKYIAQTPLLANVDPTSIVGKINTSAIAESIVGNESPTVPNQQATTNPSGSDSKKRRLYLRPPGIPDYKPTPISELNRRKSAEKCTNSNDTQNSKVKTPSTADYSPTPGQDAETTDFSSIDEEDDEEEQQKLHSEFDMLDEVIAENSKANSKKYSSKELKRRKQALGKLKNLSIQGTESPTKNDKNNVDKERRNSDTQKSNIQKDAPVSEEQPSKDDIFPKPHILVPVVSQVTRKPWTPGGAARPVKSSAPDMLEAVLQVLDGPPNPPPAPVTQPPPTATGYKVADLTKEIQSLTNIGSVNTNTEKSSEVVDNGKDDTEKSTEAGSLKTSNEKGSQGGLVDEKHDTLKTDAIKEKEGEKEEENNSQKKNSGDSESDSEQSKVSRKRSRSHGRSSSREHRRRKRRRREKKLKHKRNKSKKRRRKRSYSTEYDSEMASDGLQNDDDDDVVDDANDVAGNDVNVKQEKSDDESELKQEGASDDSSKEKENRLHKENSDSEYMSSKSDKARSRKRKKSKHRRKSKRKYKKRRYRSSSSTDGSYSSSSDDGHRSRKRRRRGVDLSIVKQEDDDVIDLTVIKDESESSDGIEPLIVSSVKEEKQLQEKGKQTLMPKTVLEPKSEDISSNSVETKSTSSKPDKKEATTKVVSDLKDQCKSLDSSEESKSSKSTSDRSPAADKEDKSKSRTSSMDSSQSSGPPHDTDTEQLPRTSDAKAFAAVAEKPAATVYSSKTKTLTEISIFDSLRDGSKASSIKTIKKKRVEELSSSSLTPTLSDDEELLKKVTTSSSSHRSSTSSLRRSSSSQTSSSKHISKSSSSSNKSSSSSSHHSDSSKAKSGSSSSKGSSSHSSSGDKLKSSHDSKKNTGSSSSSVTDKDKKDRTGSSKSSSGSSKQRSSSQSSNVGSDKETKNVSGSHHSSHTKSHRSDKDKSSKERSSSKSSSKTIKDPSSHSSRSKNGLNAKNVSSQDSEGVSDREPFSFNAGYSQGSSDDNDGDGSPLPDLSALDAIPEEDWNMLTASPLQDENDGGDHLEGTEAAEDECLKLYNDFQQPPPRAPTQKKRASDASSAVAAAEEAAASSSSRIQRIARPGAAGNLLRRQDRPLPPYVRKTPDQVMMERYAKLRSEGEELRQKLAERKAQLQSSSRPSLASSTDRRPGAPSAAPPATAAFALGPGGSRKHRIGVPSNVSAMITASKALKRQQSTSTRSPSSVSAYSKESAINRASTSAAPPESTLATAGAKGMKRVAHVPKLEVLARPIIASEFGAKVPQNVRQRYLNSFVDEAIKFADTQADAFNIAIAEEKVCYRRATSRAVYLSLAVNTTKRLRGSTISDQAKELMESMAAAVTEPPSSAGSSSARPGALPPATAPRPRVQNHFSNLAGGGQKGSWSIEKPIKTDIKSKLESLKGVKLYQFVQRYVLTKEQLEENGYPQAHPDIKGKAVVCKVDNRKRLSPSPTERYCSRCGILFLVDDWGFPKTIANCVHHWGRMYKRRGACGFESRYSCCSGDHESGGCCLASTHVSDNYDPNNLTGFVRTLPKEPDSTGDFGVYALDCEMSYTTAGNELTRITVVGHDNAIVYETYVQPDNHILDYNTRFSGISEEDLEDCKTTIRDVQAALLTRFSSKTVLIGHSLESDLVALKLIHHTVIDTSVTFPHKMGAPYKRALRNLASDHLKKLIQNDVGGHDSAEDAITCMELLHWKIKEDLKTTSL